jgi:hypothetical protein
VARLLESTAIYLNTHTQQHRCILQHTSQHRYILVQVYRHTHTTTPLYTRSSIQTHAHNNTDIYLNKYTDTRTQQHRYILGQVYRHITTPLYTCSSIYTIITSRHTQQPPVGTDELGQIARPHPVSQIHTSNRVTILTSRSKARDLILSSRRCPD